MEQIISCYEAFSNLHVRLVCPGGVQCSTFNLFLVFWLVPVAVTLLLFARWFQQKTAPQPRYQLGPTRPRRRRSVTPATTVEIQNRAPKIMFPQYIVTDNVPYFLHEEETLDYDCSNSWERTAEWVDTTNFMRAWREYRGSSVDVHDNYLCDSCIYCKSEQDGYIC